MKILFKCIFCTLLFFIITSASAANYIYTLNQTNNFKIVISVCNMYNATGSLHTCKEIDPEYYHLAGLLQGQITVSPDGAYAYITTVDYDHHISYLYACLINNDTGYFEYCALHHEFPGGSGDIKNMVVNNMGDKIYILFHVHNIEDDEAPPANKLMMCLSKTLVCRELDDKNFRGSLVSIAISADNRYAYFMNNRSRVYICPILEDGTFDSKFCKNSRIIDPELYLRPLYIAVNSNPSNSGAAYIVTRSGEKYPRIAYCPFEESGASFGNCTINKIKGVGIELGTILTQMSIAYSGKYAYIVPVNHSYMIRCKIIATGFENCESEKPGYYEHSTGTHFYMAFNSIAYRKDRSNDNHPVTLHFKHKVEPQVESK